MEAINTNILNLIKDLKNNDNNLNIVEKKHYSSIEIEKHLEYLKNDYLEHSKKIAINK